MSLELNLLYYNKDKFTTDSRLIQYNNYFQQNKKMMNYGNESNRLLNSCKLQCKGKINICFCICFDYFWITLLT